MRELLHHSPEYTCTNILPINLVLYDVEFFATLYTFIDRVERGGEQHCIIS